jgi:hypothetical protein
MKVVCAGCGRIGEPVFDVRDNAGRAGSICRGCELRSSSRLEVLVIDGRQFIRVLKRGPVAIEKATKKAKAQVAENETSPLRTGSQIRKGI